MDNQSECIDESTENRHAVVDPSLCRAMGRKFDFGRLKRIERTKDTILKWDCVFEGEQTSFEQGVADDDH